jgi:osmoprotectant transport system permease protein
VIIANNRTHRSVGKAQHGHAVPAAPVGNVTSVLLGTGPFFRWSYLTGQWGQIQGDLVQHIKLSVLAVAIGTVISIPLAVLAWRFRLVRAPVFGVASALYIIPSLSLFAILGPLTGFVASYLTAEIALVGYTLLILIWNTVAGLDAVPPDAREAAVALGYSPTAALVRVELPLALPYIFAGLRVATATVIGLVTVTALIGLGGLGQQITYGYNTPIIIGLVFSVALAAVFDLLLVGAQRLAVPWSRSRRGGSGG